MYVKTSQVEYWTVMYLISWLSTILGAHLDLNSYFAEVDDSHIYVFDGISHTLAHARNT